MFRRASSAGPPRTILHADMDAFYASIEVRDHPELAGRPVIVGAVSARGVVAAASYEARAFGVHSAMPAFKARQLCPQAVFLPSNMARYAAVSREVRSIFEEFTPEIEPLALDEAFLDISGSLLLFESPLALGRKLKERVREALALNVSVGIAPSKLVAKIACTLAKPDGLSWVAPEAVQSFLDPLPIRRLWGIGPVMADRLGRLNIQTLGELRLYDSEWLRRELGDRASELQARARGDDTRSVEVERLPKSYGEENTFEHDVSDRLLVCDALSAHSEAVARRLRRDGWVARTITLKLKYARRRAPESREPRNTELYPLVTRQQTLAEPTDDGAVIRRVVVSLWDEEKITKPVRLVGVTLSGLLERQSVQLELFGGGSPRAELGGVIDRIQEKFGSSAIRRGAKNPGKLSASLRLKRGE